MLSIVSKRCVASRFARRCTGWTRSLSQKVFEDDDHPMGVPDVNTAQQLPLKFRHVTNDQVFSLAIGGHHGATRERLVRNIMAVDGVDWKTARAKVEEMNRENDRFAFLVQLPYTIGVTAGVTAGTLSIPLVFYKPWVVYFAENVVKMDPSEIPVEEMTTFWSVGSFSWGYAEPVLGTLSFVLLAAQFVRANMVHISLQPYTNYVLRKRADRLCRLYPKYDRNVVREYAKTDAWHK